MSNRFATREGNPRPSLTDLQRRCSPPAPHKGHKMETGVLDYATLVPPEVQEKAKRFDVIDSLIMKSALERRFLPESELKLLLQEATALYSMFTNLYYTYKATRDGAELERYMSLKTRAESSGEKFVSAPAERAAANEVRTLKYLETVYEGWMRRAEAHMNTCKRLMNVQERKEA